MITLELCPKGINSKDSIKCEYSHWKKKRHCDALCMASLKGNNISDHSFDLPSKY